MRTEVTKNTETNSNSNSDDKPTFEKVWLMFQETDKRINELGKQIGGLGNKFGTFNEGLVLPSLEKLFETHFNCKSIAQNYKFFSNGNSMEIDMLAISEESVYIIEIKSHLKLEVIEQVQNQVEKFRKNMKEYSERKIYSVIVATHYEKDFVKNITDKGIYFISITDDLVKLKIPRNFKPIAL
jgi:hypothetical protein